jgi:ketosteroid isomerase-like protein
MLFILAMEPLQRLMEIVTEHQILSPLQFRAARIRASFYADDAAFFVNPLKEDIIGIQQLLHLFDNASGLRTNIDKCVAYAVACEETDLNLIL